MTPVRFCAVLAPVGLLRTGCTRGTVGREPEIPEGGVRIGLYKIVFQLEAFVHESIFFLPPPPHLHCPHDYNTIANRVHPRHGGAWTCNIPEGGRVKDWPLQDIISARSFCARIRVNGLTRATAAHRVHPRHGGAWTWNILEGGGGG